MQRGKKTERVKIKKQKKNIFGSVTIIQHFYAYCGLLWVARIQSLCCCTLLVSCLKEASYTIVLLKNTSWIISRHKRKVMEWKQKQHILSLSKSQLCFLIESLLSLTRRHELNILSALIKKKGGGSEMLNAVVCTIRHLK